MPFAALFFFQSCCVRTFLAHLQITSTFALLCEHLGDKYSRLDSNFPFRPPWSLRRQRDPPLSTSIAYATKFSHWIIGRLGNRRLPILWWDEPGACVLSDSCCQGFGSDVIDDVLRRFITQPSAHFEAPQTGGIREVTGHRSRFPTNGLLPLFYPPPLSLSTPLSTAQVTVKRGNNSKECKASL